MISNPESMVQILSDYAVRQPNQIFVADVLGEYTYIQVWNEVKKLGTWFVNNGYLPGDRILVECTQDVRYVICNMACQLSQMVFVPIEHKASADRIIMIAEETEAALFINEAEYDVSVKMISLKILFEELHNISDICDFDFPRADSLTEILYTTGTTGKSKGISISNRNNIALAENIQSGTEMKPGNVEIIPLPLSHSHGLRCFYANLLNGGTVVLIDGVTNVRKVFELLEKYSVTAMDVSPSAAVVLIRLSKGKLSEYNSKFDYVQVGTAALSEEIKEQLLKNLPDVRLYNFYGSTESGRTCALDFNKEKRENCIGRPTKNARFIVTDDDRNEIQSSAENMGLLASAGPMNMMEYYKQPELTSEIMRDGFIFTNDLGYIDEDGFVYVLGRKDDVINYKGIKIAPDEIEGVASGYEGIIDCGCVGKVDKVSGQVPVLFIQVENQEEFDKKSFIDYLGKHIDGNKMPKDVLFIDSIPRTYNGKIQRKELKKQFDM